MNRSTVVPWLLVAVVVAFLFAPVVLVILFSFNAGGSPGFPLEGLTLKWYEQVFDDAVVREALRNSAIAAICTAAIVVPLGAAAALVLSRRRSKLLDAVTTLLVAPLVLPGLFVGIALLSFLSRIGAELSLATVVAGHALVTLPFVVVIVNARLLRVDRSIEEAARDLGASWAQTFRKIMLPLIAPALLGASLLAIAWSADEFVITLFTNGGDTTVPVLIFGQLRRGVDPSINAIASLILATTLVMTFLAGRFLSVRDLAR